ncbi:ATP-binding protein [Methylobacterium sp. Leaf100]|uniref:ATP-binding protein n=1 Tax=Methylobacterium sp. Leaf100 TaxID=1736252 RepID=UPI000ABC7A67|nr:ATP-binding protein [Methylobacterium sp. Leaf100]
MTRADELFRRLRNDGVGEIRRMIEAAYSEDLFIDYKTANTSFPSRSLDKFDRKNLAKALSGFGNGDGGIIVWGVICKRGEVGDVPSGEKLIVDAAAFKSILDGEMGGLVSPQNSKAENISLIVGEGQSGFVVTYIPPGFDIPFHSNHPEAQGYYMRAGSSFHKVTPGILAGMFGRKPNAELSLSARMRLQYNPGGQFTKAAIVISARNVGRGMGRDLYIRADAPETSAVSYHLGRKDRWEYLPSSDHRWVVGSLTNGIVLPPGVQFEVLEITYMCMIGTETDLDISLSMGLDGGLGAELKIQIPSDIMWRLGTAWTDPDNRSKLDEVQKISDRILIQHHNEVGPMGLTFPSLPFIGG